MPTVSFLSSTFIFSNVGFFLFYFIECCNRNYVTLYSGIKFKGVMLKSLSVASKVISLSLVLTLDPPWSMQSSLTSASDSLFELVSLISSILYFDLQADAKLLSFLHFRHFYHMQKIC